MPADIGLVLGLTFGITGGCVLFCFVTNGCETGPRESNGQGCDCCGDGIERSPSSPTAVVVQQPTPSSSSSC